jgi:hypothetical protein
MQAPLAPPPEVVKEDIIEEEQRESPDKSENYDDERFDSPSATDQSKVPTPAYDP